MDESTHGSGDPLCLEFTNTASARATAAPKEHLLHSYADLLAWSVQRQIVTPAAAQRLEAGAAEHPAAAAEALGEAVALREALYRIFTRYADGELPIAADLARLNATLGTAAAQRRLVGGEGSFTWQWEEDSDDLASPLWRIAQSAADLLTSPELDRVRECAKEHCNWLFVDRSKNRSRRWCDMQQCGNVAKVRRYRSRKQAAV
jgi:predicted RNA-binding Zn ribbon-like protein